MLDNVNYSVKEQKKRHGSTITKTEISIIQSS